jgi:hypothetical protein
LFTHPNSPEKAKITVNIGMARNIVTHFALNRSFRRGIALVWSLI